jgi:phage terminase large subunit
MTEARIQLPPKLVPMFAPPRGSVQYRAPYGGRGSGKSFNVAKMAAVFAYAEPLRVLCTREFQASIKESFHAELKAAIASEPWLEAHYDVGVDYLRGANGTEFIFRGLRQSINSVKSLAKIDLTIVEEAEDVPEASWLALEATVFRQPKSELWPIWNPRLDGSPVDMRFRKHTPANAIVTEINWNDNPFFPEGLDTLRRREMGALIRRPMRTSGRAHTSSIPIARCSPANGGSPSSSRKTSGMARIRAATSAMRRIRRRRCAAMSTATRSTSAMRRAAARSNSMRSAPRSAPTSPITSVTSADGIARHPGSISILTRNGVPKAEGAPKWQGSVDDGIRFLRSFREIVFHPRCTNTIREARLYSYKVDRLTGDILPVLVDANNHWIDALRYSIAPLIKGAGYNLAALLG